MTERLIQVPADEFEGLRASEARHRLSFENSPVCLGRATLDGTLLDVNATFCAWLGYDRADLLGKRTHDITHPDDLGRTQAQLDAMDDDGQRFTMEKRYLRRDGSTVWGRVSGATRSDASGRPVYVDFAIQDVTAERLTQEALASTERRLAEINDALADVVFSVRMPERLIAYVNRAVTTVFQYDPEEVVGRTTRMFYPSEDAYAEFGGGLVAALDEGRPHVAMETQLVRKDGQRIWAAINTTFIHVDGVLSRVVSVVRDISTRKAMEQALQQAQKLESLGTLAGGIAHDMNNVLAVILGLGSLLAEQLGPNSPEGEDVKEIVAAANRGRSLVRNLLGFARKGDYHRRRISPQQPVADLVQILKRSVPKKIRITTHLGPETADVEADPVQLIQSLLNISLNASDAIQGSGTIAISTATQDLARGAVDDLEPGRYVRFQIRDDGHGMDEATRRRAMEPFFTTKEPGKGTGLGLSMAYGFAKQHGGAVSIDSAPDEGTTVRVWLPAQSPPHRGTSADAKPARARPAVATDAVSPRLTVLVVDDEDAVRRSAERLLVANGYDVIQAANGADAVDSYQRRPEAVDVVLLDLSMPVMDGVECFDQLTAIDPQARIIVCTGHARSEVAEELLRRGAVELLRKPYEAAEVTAAIVRAATGRRT